MRARGGGCFKKGKGWAVGGWRFIHYLVICVVRSSTEFRTGNARREVVKGL